MELEQKKYKVRQKKFEAVSLWVRWRWYADGAIRNNERGNARTHSSTHLRNDIYVHIRSQRSSG